MIQEDINDYQPQGNLGHTLKAIDYEIRQKDQRGSLTSRERREIQLQILADSLSGRAPPKLFLDDRL